MLIKEMQSLCLDVKVLTEDHEEIEIKEVSDDSAIEDVMKSDSEVWMKTRRRMNSLS